MGYIIQKMTPVYAADISRWSYDPPYDIYNGSSDKDFIDELLCGDYFAVTDNRDTSDVRRLVGFYCFRSSATVPYGNRVGVYDEDMLDIGLGLRPELCGKGLGRGYMRALLKFASYLFGSTCYRLTVAAFNTRAIKLYEDIGFVRKSNFERFDDENKNMTFIVMELCKDR